MIFSISGISDSTIDFAITSCSSEILYGDGSVLSSYLAVMVLPGIARSLFPLESFVCVKTTSASKIPESSDVSVAATETPAESESEETSTLR